MSKTPLAWLQLSRNRPRLLIALSGIAFANILMFMQLGFQSALYNSNTRIHRLLVTDLVMINPKARNLGNLDRFPRRRLFQAQGVEGVAETDAVYIQAGIWKNPTTRDKRAVLVFGFNPTNSVLNLDDIKQNLKLIKLPDVLLFDRAARGEYDATIAELTQGKTITTELEGRTIQLKGLFTIGASFIADGTVITSDQNFWRIFPRRQPGEVNLGLIHLQAGTDPQAMAAFLNQHLGNDVKVLTREQFIEFETYWWQNNTAIGFIFSLGTAMGFIVGIVIVYQILYSDVTDHLAEYATLKAMGYRMIYLLTVLFQEAIILALLGYIPGISLSIGMYAMTQNATRLPLVMTVSRASTVLILTIIMCLISGAIAIRKLRSADPADLF